METSNTHDYEKQEGEKKKKEKRPMPFIRSEIGLRRMPHILLHTFLAAKSDLA